MKFKYLLFFLIIFLIAVIGLYFFQTKNSDKTFFISPLVEGNTLNVSAFSIENAPSASLRGKITDMTGEISWQGRLATEAAKIYSPVTIQQGEKLITGEKSSLKLDFKAGCSVELSPQTEIEVIQTLPDNIVFSQNSGTANYVKTGAYPVSVRISNLLVESDGEAIISIDPEDFLITLDLKSGSAIAAYNDLDYLSHEIIVEAGETLSFNDDTRKAVLK